MDNKNTTLPCLQSVDSSWNREDKLLLVFYLKHIFSLEDQYFAPLFLEKTKEDAIDLIGKFNRSISGAPKRISCSQLRSATFSFGGCLNKHLCFLCPYSGIYKNEFQDKEKILLYYQLAFYNLKHLLERNKLKLDNVIQSYYPIYQGDILIDALPLSFIGRFFLFDGQPIISYPDDPEEFVKIHVEGIRNAVSHRVTMQSKKNPYYLAQDPGAYENAVFDCSKNLYTAITTLNSSSVSYINPIKPLDKVTVIDGRMVERIFSALAVSRIKYVPLDVRKYPAPELKKLEMSQIQMNSEDVKVDYDVIRNTKSNHQNAASIINQDLPVGAGALNGKSIDNEIDFMMFDSLSNSLEQKDDEEVYKRCEVKDSDHDLMVDPLRQGDIILDNEAWYVHPASKEDFNLIMRSIYQSASYLCMECAVLDGREGVLLMGSNNDFIFYPLRDYGPREIKKIISKKADIYSSHTFEVSALLHKNKIYDFNIHDIAIALNYFNTPYDILSKDLNFRMMQYKSIYKVVLENVSDKDKKHIFLLERYHEIIASNGLKAPFQDLNYIYKKDSEGEFTSTYSEKNLPEVRGTFYWLHIDLLSHFKAITNDDWTSMYIEICVRLNKYLPFEKGIAFVLQLDANGIMIYVSGASFMQVEAGEYLKACARRVMRDTFGLRVKYDSHIRYQSFSPEEEVRF